MKPLFAALAFLLATACDNKPPPVTPRSTRADANEPSTRLGAVGESCTKASECASEICEGEGCDDARPGTCADPKRMCTRDLQQYCGCDGMEFNSSGSCPGSRFKQRGACGGS